MKRYFLGTALLMVGVSTLVHAQQPTNPAVKPGADSAKAAAPKKQTVADKTKSSKNKTISSNKTTMFEETVVIISTSSADATTRNAITNEAIELRFFFVYFLPSTSSMPKTFVFSSSAKTTVKIRRKGRTTSNTPILPKKSIMSLNWLAIFLLHLLTGLYINFSIDFKVAR